MIQNGSQVYIKAVKLPEGNIQKNVGDHGFNSDSEFLNDATLKAHNPLEEKKLMWN